MTCRGELPTLICLAQPGTPHSIAPCLCSPHPVPHCVHADSDPVFDPCYQYLSFLSITHTLLWLQPAGTAYDGYLSACTVYLDASGDASLQAGSEPSTVLTDGAFSMQVGAGASIWRLGSRASSIHAP